MRTKWLINLPCRKIRILWDFLKPIIFMFLEIIQYIRCTLQSFRNTFFSKIFVGHLSIFGATDTPVSDCCWQSPLGFKARFQSLIWTLRGIPDICSEIHLWCDTSAGVYGQHSSQSLSPHVYFSRGRMLDLNHRPPAWQADALTTRPQRPGSSYQKHFG